MPHEHMFPKWLLHLKAERKEKGKGARALSYLHLGNRDRHPGRPAHTLALLKRNPGLRDPKSYVIGSRQACPLLWSETLFLSSKVPSKPSLCSGEIVCLFSKVVCLSNMLEKIVWNKRHSVPLLARYTVRDHGELSPNNILLENFCPSITGHL